MLSAVSEQANEARGKARRKRQPYQTKGAALPDDLRTRLSAIVARDGLRQAATVFYLNEYTLMKAAAGGVVVPSTTELIRLKLDELDRTSNALPESA